MHIRDLHDMPKIPIGEYLFVTLIPDGTGKNSYQFIKQGDKVELIFPEDEYYFLSQCNKQAGYEVYCLDRGPYYVVYMASPNSDLTYVCIKNCNNTKKPFLIGNKYLRKFTEK